MKEEIAKGTFQSALFILSYLKTVSSIILRTGQRQKQRNGNLIRCYTFAYAWSNDLYCHHIAVTCPFYWWINRSLSLFPHSSPPPFRPGKHKSIPLPSQSNIQENLLEMHSCQAITHALKFIFFLSVFWSSYIYWAPTLLNVFITWG